MAFQEPTSGELNGHPAFVLPLHTDGNHVLDVIVPTGGEQRGDIFIATPDRSKVLPTKGTAQVQEAIEGVPATAQVNGNHLVTYLVPRLHCFVARLYVPGHPTCI